MGIGRPKKILVGSALEFLDVLEDLGADAYGHSLHKCLCKACGQTCILRVDEVQADKGCGCMRRVRQGRKMLGRKLNFKHGFAYSPEYRVYRAMIQRCYNQETYTVSYRSYGGAGVRVARRWRGKNGFIHFMADLGKRPSPQHSLSRIADLGDYKPSNVVWGDRKHQAEQKRIKRARLKEKS